MKLDFKLFSRQSRFRGLKCGEIQCLNSYVKIAAQRLEGNGEVIRFHYRIVPYEYFNPKLGKIGTNYFDFDVEYKRERKLIQCVPDGLLTEDTMVCRLDAMELKALDLKLPLEIWGDEILFGTNPAYRESLINFFS